MVSYEMMRFLSKTSYEIVIKTGKVSYEMMRFLSKTSYEIRKNRLSLQMQ